MKNCQKLLHIIDRVVWWLIALLPLILLVIGAVNRVPVSVETVLTQLGFDVTTNNIIYTALNDLFGATGDFLQMSASSSFIAYATYFVMVNLMHLIIDILLVLVDWCHDMLKGAFRK